MDPDLELLERWCAGDRGAGNTLFQRHFDSVCRFFQNKLDRDFDELVQTTFMACVRSRDQFRRQSSFRTYLFTIARHELYGYLRRRRDQNLDFGVTSLAALETTARSLLDRNQRHLRLLHALRAMPVEQQVLLELHYWEGMSPTELAEVLEIPAATARTRLFRARQALRSQMDAQAGAPAPTQQSLEDLDAWARAVRDLGPALEPDPEPEQISPRDRDPGEID
jgi:RNA polymerase sigma-70 factor (ECF subfamily)